MEKYSGYFIMPELGGMYYRLIDEKTSFFISLNEKNLLKEQPIDNQLTFEMNENIFDLLYKQTDNLRNYKLVRYPQEKKSLDKSKSIAIDGEIIFGRDKFDLLTVVQKGSELQITLEMDTENRTLNKCIVFQSLIFYSSIELDTYENSNTTLSWLKRKSNFEEIEYSELLLEKIRIRPDYTEMTFKHYRLSCYDHVFDIISENYYIIDL